MLKKILIFLLFFNFNDIHGHTYILENQSDTLIVPNEEFEDCSSLGFTNNNINRPNPLLVLFKHKHKKNKRLTAAILAFPFPFGIVGLHRIYLGCPPYVPVVYIASLGGIFGFLPLIDFCVLTFGKDFEKYSNRGSVFMWVN